MTLTTTDMERIAEQIEGELNDTRRRFMQLEKAHPGWDRSHPTVIAALGEVHGRQMEALRVLRQEIARLNRSGSALISIRARGAKDALAKLVQQSQQNT